MRGRFIERECPMEIGIRGEALDLMKRRRFGRAPRYGKLGTKLPRRDAQRCKDEGVLAGGRCRQDIAIDATDRARGGHHGDRPPIVLVVSADHDTIDRLDGELGVGKSLARRVEQDLFERPSRVRYMGVDRDANHADPTGVGHELPPACESLVSAKAWRASSIETARSLARIGGTSPSRRAGKSAWTSPPSRLTSLR